MAGKPTGEYSQFTHCPLEAAGVNECVYGEVPSGEIVLNKIKIPIAHTIALQGGQVVTGTEETFVNATEGATLSKTAEEVPGGFGSSPLTVTLELVGSVTLSRTKLAAGEGTALKLPVRAHLKNMFLTETCFIGSSAKPITLNLTTGTTSPPEPNKPIKGSPGTFESKEAGKLLIYKNDALVENAFSVPTAEGCGTLATPLINSQFGLPAAAGFNTVVFKGTTKFANAGAVHESE
ncbi:MAG TPA: hypothetical protein VGI76_04980 [Solirubrobacteraceae bacterium]|jgi:hypothetical protein